MKAKIKIVEREIWKDIEGFDGIYKISNKGRVKSLHRNKESGGLIMKTRPGRRGDECVVLTDTEGGLCFKYLHRIVAEHFVPNPENKRIVRRIDGNRMNNESSNLRWENIWDDVKYYCKGDTKDEDFGVCKLMENCYRVRLKINHEDIYICCYETKEEAKSKYEEARAIYKEHGIEAVREFAKNCYKDRYTSQYRNVSYDSGGKKWMVQVKQNKEVLLRGRFETEREAVDAVIDCRKKHKIPLHPTHLEYLTK